MKKENSDFSGGHFTCEHIYLRTDTNSPEVTGHMLMKVLNHLVLRGCNPSTGWVRDSDIHDPISKDNKTKTPIINRILDYRCDSK